MIRLFFTIALGLAAVSHASAQTMTLSTTSNDYVTTPVFSDVTSFSINIEIDAPLAVGVYVDPPIINVTYQVTGTLVAGTPSGFPAFDLQRNITGDEFYAQGSSLSFEIASFAELSDGVQAAELVGSGTILTLNAREVGNGRFHPALFVLDSNSTGRLQNSDNIHTVDPLLQVDFGDEYITDLAYDPGNTTLINGPFTAPKKNNGGSSAPLSVAVLLLLALCAQSLRQRVFVRRS